MARSRDFPVQGSVGGPNQSGAVAAMLTVFDQNSFQEMTIGTSDRLRIASVQLNSTEAAVTLRAVGANAAGNAVTAKSAANNTYTIAGDHVTRYQTYTHIITRGATAENGLHPITLVAAAAGPTTVITVSTDLANGTADGKVHGLDHEVDTILEADIAADQGFTAATFPAGIAVRPGHAPFIVGGTAGMRLQIQGTLKAN